MPKYTTFQYSIKQYGRFDSDNVSTDTNFKFLQARMCIYVNGKEVWIYSTKGITVNGKKNKFRLKSNKNEIIYQESFQIHGNRDKIRIKSNKDDYIYSMRGWG